MCNIATSSSEVQPASVMKRTRKQNTKYFSSSSSSSASASSSSSCSSLKPLKRGSRTKTRKPKFVSLRLQLSESSNKTVQPKLKPKPRPRPRPRPKLKDQAESQAEEAEVNDLLEEQNVALLFRSDGGGSLDGLLEEEEEATSTSPSSEEAVRCPAEEEWLVRKAMRRRESEEGRWVCYSEVVEEKKEVMEEVTSCCVTGKKTTSLGLLSLKLDHQGIMNAWSDKGSLYVAGEEAPQTVPDLLTGLFLHNAFLPHVGWEGWGNGGVGNALNVPEVCGANKVKEEMGWKLGQREASVQRYKEKRQSRLFSKKIRYEVRKLNAEKRPRMKGRFVKREGEV